MGYVKLSPYMIDLWLLSLLLAALAGARAVVYGIPFSFFPLVAHHVRSLLFLEGYWGPLRFPLEPHKLYYIIYNNLY